METELVLSAMALIGIAIVIPLFMLVTTVFGPRASGAIKNQPYESGVKRMIGLAEQKFSVKFYLLAILFLLFDIEAVFMYPWAVNVRELGWYGFIVMLLFVDVLFAGLIYIIRKGVLNWR